MRLPGFLLAIILVFFAPAVFGADAFKKADTLRRQKKYDLARQEYQKVAAENAKTNTAYAAQIRAAQCLIDKKDYKGFVSEAAA